LTYLSKTICKPGTNSVKINGTADYVTVKNIRVTKHTDICNDGSKCGMFGDTIDIYNPSELNPYNVLPLNGLTPTFDSMGTGEITSAPSGWGHNFIGRFGEGNWSMEVVDVDDLPGFSKAIKINTTYADGESINSGGWTSPFTNKETSPPTMYGMWVKVTVGRAEFGNLNSSNRITVLNTDSNGEWVFVTSPIDIVNS